MSSESASTGAEPPAGTERLALVSFLFRSGVLAAGPDNDGAGGVAFGDAPGERRSRNGDWTALSSIEFVAEQFHDREVAARAAAAAAAATAAATAGDWAAMAPIFVAHHFNGYALAHLYARALAAGQLEFARALRGRGGVCLDVVRQAACCARSVGALERLQAENVLDAFSVDSWYLGNEIEGGGQLTPGELRYIAARAGDELSTTWLYLRAWRAGGAAFADEIRALRGARLERHELERLYRERPWVYQNRVHDGPEFLRWVLSWTPEADAIAAGVSREEWREARPTAGWLTKPAARPE